MMLGENVIAICPRETYMPKRRIAPTKDYIENIIVMQILQVQKPLEEYRNRADARFVPSQWETALLCNDVSHWLGANLESALRK